MTLPSRVLAVSLVALSVAAACVGEVRTEQSRNAFAIQKSASAGCAGLRCVDCLAQSCRFCDGACVPLGEFATECLVEVTDAEMCPLDTKADGPQGRPPAYAEQHRPWVAPEPPDGGPAP